MIDVIIQQEREKKLLSIYSRKAKAAAAVSYAPFQHNLLFSYKESFLDFEKMTQECRNLVELSAKGESDNPAFIHTFCSIGMVAEAFGCELAMPDGQFPWVKPVLSNIARVDSLEPKSVRSLPYYGRMRQWVEFAQKAFGTELPMWSLDIQSPFSVAAQIIEPQELLLACYDNPGAVHALLRMVTDVIIELHEDHMAQMEHPGYPGRNFPSVSENIGLCLADDTPLIMLSGELYREYAMPYANELSRRFGGLHVHSCGNYAHNMDAVLEIEGVRSVQLHAGPGEYMLPSEAGSDCGFVDALKKVTVFIDTNPISRGDGWSQAPNAFYSEYLIPRLKLNTPEWLILETPAPSGDPESYAFYSAQTNQYLKELGY